MPASWINDSVTWRKAKAVYFNDAGTWRRLKAIWINSSGTWRKVFSALLAISGSATAFAGSTAKPANARVNFNADGTITDGGSAVAGTHSYTGSANWYFSTVGGIGSSFYIRFTQPAATFTSSPALGTIGSLSAGGYVACPAEAGEENIDDVLVEIFYDSGGTQLFASGIFNMDARGS